MFFFLLLNTKEDILKNVDSRTISLAFDLRCMGKKYNGSQWELKRFDYQHSSKNIPFKTILE